MSTGKVDLTLLKRLVGELEAHLQKAESIKQSGNKVGEEYVVEMSRAVGMTSGIMQEATLLISDIHTVIRNSQAPASGEDLLTKLFKTPPSSN